MVDHESTDGTAALARTAGARVVLGEGSMGALRALALSEVSSKWVLGLDADERLPPGGLKRVRVAIEGAAPDVAAFALPIRTYLGDRFLRWGGFYPARRVRVFRREATRWDPASRVHERPQLAGRTERLELRIEHFAFADLEVFRRRQLRYAAWAAVELREGGRRPALLDGIFRAGWRVFRNALLRGGFLMGGLGLRLAWIQGEAVWKRTKWARTGLPTTPPL